jgi:hypothetical protein
MTILRAKKPTVILAAMIISSLSILPRASSSSATVEAAKRSPLQANAVVDDTAKRRAVDALGALPLSFEEVRDQTNNRATFIARGARLDFRITPTEAVMRLHRADNSSERLPLAASSTGGIADEQRQAVMPHPRSASGAARKTVLLKMRLIGANPHASLVGEEQLSARSNYFIGNDEAQWRMDVPNYPRVKIVQVYRGVDMVYHGAGRQLEHDFRVAPGASSRAIRLAFDGAQKVTIDAAGELVIKTKLGAIRQLKPVAYQEVDGVRKVVGSRYKMRAERVVGFEVGGYDHNKPLVIDPVLVYSTLIGGSGNDSGASVAVDSTGNVVTKLNAAGDALVYSTYFGGHSDDTGFGIAVDSAGDAYVIGESGSANLQTTPGAFQSLNRGVGSDAFVARISSPYAITGVSIKGKKLLVRGDGFSSGAVIALNGEQQQTENDETSPNTLLVSRKAGKKIFAGQTVTIQVRNPDGRMSNPFSFTRGVD